MEHQKELIVGTDAAHQLALKNQTAEVLIALENQLLRLLSLVDVQKAARSAS